MKRSMMRKAGQVRPAFLKKEIKEGENIYVNCGKRRGFWSACPPAHDTEWQKCRFRTGQ